MKLSIITINYNNLGGLLRTVESVINQTWREFEFIIIDGGSTDGSFEYIQKMQEYFNYWVCEPDKGIYNAMNKGIKVANGEYLLFLNSGDLLIEEISTDFLTGGNLVIYSQRRALLLCESLTEMRKYLKTYMIPHQSTFIRASAFNDIGLYNERYRIAGDYEWFLRLFHSSNTSYRLVNSPLIVMEQGGIGSKSSYRNIYENNFARWLYYNDWFSLIRAIKNLIKIYLLSLEK